MNKDIRNRDKDDNLHGEQITYYINGNMMWINNFHHGKRNGYQAWFNPSNIILHKVYFNMDKKIYKEIHLSKQIKIKI